MWHQSPSDRLRRAHRAARPLRLEGLEPRCLLSANITFIGGSLSVVCDAARDWVQVTDNGDGSAIVAVPSDPANAAPALFTGVTDITIDTGNGNNRVDYVLDAGAVLPGAFTPAGIVLRAGVGKDRLFLTQHLPAVPDGEVEGRKADVQVDLVGGKNVFQLAADGAAPAAPGDSPALVNLTFLGGVGKDSANLSFTGLFTEVFVDTIGVRGKDTVAMTYADVPVGLVSPLTVSMSEGRDVFRLTAASPIPADPTSTGLAIAFDGLGGSDSCSMSFFDVFTSSVALDMGLGNDSVAITYYRLAGSSFSNVVADMGEGKDRFQLTASSPRRLVPAGAGLFLDLDSLGSTMTTLSIADAPSEVYLNGGLGSDKVLARYRRPVGTSYVRADLGEGRNSFTLDAVPDPLDLPGIAPGDLDVQVAGGDFGNVVNLSFSDAFRSVVTLDMGLGSDKVLARYRGVPGNSSIQADLGEGRNSFTLDAAADPLDLPGIAPGDLHVQVAGGDFGNVVNLSFFHVFPTIQVNVGEGNDSASITMDGLPVGPTVPINVDMANGDNAFRILADGDPPAGPPVGARGAVSLWLSGGTGTDVATLSFLDVLTSATVNLGDGSNSANILLDAPVSLANGGAGTGGLNQVSVLGGVSTDQFYVTLGSPAGSAGAVAALGSVDALLDAGGGNNTVRYTVGGDIALRQDIAATILTGAGNDFLDVIARSVFCDGSLRLATDLGIGLDAFNCLVVADVNTTGLVDFAAGLGSSTDDCNLEFRGQINGDVKLLVDGADGNDTLQTYIIPTLGSTGTLDVELSGGLNNDELSFLVWGLQGQLPALGASLLADGGANYDRAWVVNGVTALNIEDLRIAPEP